MTTSTIAIDRLATALDLSTREHVSIVGGGGKTTTLFALADALDPPVVMTTTTKMGSDRTTSHAVVLDPTDDELRAALARHRRVLVWKHRGDHRADGVSPLDCDRWFETHVADHVVVEADGSRRRPFKAPYPYEPVVPETTTLLLACIGARAFGRPIAHHQALAFLITDMRMAVDGARLLVHEAAWWVDASLPADGVAASAFLECADAAGFVGPNGVQILGGHGFMQDHPVEKYMREIRALGLVLGGGDAARELAGRALLREPGRVALSQVAGS